MSISSRLFRSTFFQLVGKFLSRSVGLLSTLVLARLLTPNDFGLVAIASLVVFFFDAMSQVGMREYLIQKSELYPREIDSAWTFNLLVKIVFFIAFVLLVPTISEFYNNPHLSDVLYVVSVVPLLTGFQSVGIALSQRELNYLPSMQVEVSSKLCSFILMLTLLIFFQNYWVMIISLVSSYFFRVIASYIFIPHKVSFSLFHLKEQWEFSKWVLPKGVIGFLKAEIDTLVVSKFFGLSQLGGFNLIKSLVNMIGGEIVRPATEPLLSSFSLSKGDSEKVAFQTLMSFSVVSLLIIPVVFYLCTFSQLVIVNLYGSQWVEFAHIIEILAPLIYIFSMAGVISNIFTSQGMVKHLFYIELVTLFSLTLVLLTLELVSLESFALARVGVSICFWCITLIYLTRLIKFDVLALLVVICFSLVFCVLSVYPALVLNELLEVENFMELIISGGVFISLYVLFIGLMIYMLKSNQNVAYLIWVLKENIWDRAFFRK